MSETAALTKRVRIEGPLEAFGAVDRVHVVSDGGLSKPLFVSGYGDVETLAADIARLERHTRTRSPDAEPSAFVA